jgi:hypothetical protein
VIRWLGWFLLVPQAFLLGGWLSECGLPIVDVGAVLGLFCVLFASPRALPGLLLGAAVGRAVVDEASVAVQVLVLGIPIALLLPFRGLFYRQNPAWQVAAATLFAVAIPKLASCCGQWFAAPSPSAAFDAGRVVATALLGPLSLLLLRRLPPLRAFVEPAA